MEMNFVDSKSLLRVTIKERSHTVLRGGNTSVEELTTKIIL